MKEHFISRIFLFTLPLFLLFLSIALIDSFNLFNINIIDYNIKKQHAVRLNYCLWKLIEYKRNPQKNILLGDSRIGLFDTEHIQQKYNISLYDFSYGGGNLNEAISTFWFAADKIKLDTVYVGISIDLYNYSNVRNRVMDAIKTIKNPFVYIVNRNVFEAAIYCLRSIIKNRKIEIEKPPMSREVFWQYQLKEVACRYYANYIYPQKYYCELERISLYCKKNGIYLCFIILPTHTDLQGLIDVYNLGKDHEKFIKDVRSLGDTYDFNKRNIITSNKNNFNDPFHIKKDVLNNMYIPILFNRSQSDSDLIFNYYGTN